MIWPSTKLLLFCYFFVLLLLFPVVAAFLHCICFFCVCVLEFASFLCFCSRFCNLLSTTVEFTQKTLAWFLVLIILCSGHLALSSFSRRTLQGDVEFVQGSRCECPGFNSPGWLFSGCYPPMKCWHQEMWQSLNKLHGLATGVCCTLSESLDLYPGSLWLTFMPSHTTLLVLRVFDWIPLLYIVLPHEYWLVGFHKHFPQFNCSPAETVKIYIQMYIFS